MRQFIRIDQKFNTLYERVIIDNKIKNNIIKDFQPVLYSHSKTKTDFMNFLQTGYVTPNKFKTISEMRDFIKFCKSECKNRLESGQCNKECSENEFCPLQIFGDSDPVTQFINEQNYDSFETSLLTYSIIDIETNSTTYDPETDTYTDHGFPDPGSANYPITAICDYRNDTDTFYVFTTAPNWSKEVSKLKYKEKVVYNYFETETELLDSWLRFWNKNIPAIISGWNSNFYDIPYIINRTKKILPGKEVLLSPFKIIEEKNFSNQQTFTIFGVTSLDYLDLYKKFQLTPRESYKLDYISKIELGLENKKLEFEGTHGEFYFKDPINFIDYNIQDVHCVSEFEKKLKFIQLAAYIGYFSFMNFNLVVSSIATWERLIYHVYKKQNILPFVKLTEKEPQKDFMGAYVHEVVKGFHSLVCCWDFASLYPSLIRSENLFFDAYIGGKKRNEILTKVLNSLPSEATEEYKKSGNIIEWLISNRLPEDVIKIIKEYNVCITPLLEFFDKGKNSCCVNMISEIYFDRKKNKKLAFEHSENAKEIAKILESRGVKIEE